MPTQEQARTVIVQVDLDRMSGPDVGPSVPVITHQLTTDKLSFEPWWAEVMNYLDSVSSDLHKVVLAASREILRALADYPDERPQVSVVLVDDSNEPWPKADQQKALDQMGWQFTTALTESRLINDSLWVIITEDLVACLVLLIKTYLVSNLADLVHYMCHFRQRPLSNVVTEVDYWIAGVNLLPRTVFFSPDEAWQLVYCYGIPIEMAKSLQETFEGKRPSVNEIADWIVEARHSTRFRKYFKA